MNRVAAADLISTFDAAGAYWQTRVRPGDKGLTSFVCDEGIFEFLRTPSGGKACGSTFIRAIQRVLEPLQNFTDSYVDDMILHTHAGKNPDAFILHLQQMECFLKRIRETRITIELSKCKFAHREVKFCGKIVGSGGIRLLSVT